VQLLSSSQQPLDYLFPRILPHISPALGAAKLSLKLYVHKVSLKIPMCTHHLGHRG